MTGGHIFKSRTLAHYGKRKVENNKSTELKFISLLKAKNITGWRRNYPLVGSPDFVFPRLKIAVFIDGCFWHGCSSHCRMPSSNLYYWNDKIEKNKIRDKKITKILKTRNWQVIRIWEHEIKTGKLSQKLKRMKQPAQEAHQHR